MSLTLRIPSPPPPTGQIELDIWLQGLTSAINQIPGYSLISTSAGPNSVETAESGTLSIDLGSSNTTFWAKTSGSTTTGWSALAVLPVAVAGIAPGTARQVLETVGGAAAWASSLSLPGALEVVSTISFNSTARGPDGSTGVPTYGFKSDPDSGMYIDGPLGLAFGGAQRITIAAGGLNFWTPAGDIKVWENGDNFQWFRIKTSSGGPHFRLLDTAGARRFDADMSTGSVSVYGQLSVGTSVTSGKAFVEQGSATDAIPVLTLRQADISEEFLRLQGNAVGSQTTNSFVSAGAVSITTLAGYAKVFVVDDGNVLADQAYYMPLYELS